MYKNKLPAADIGFKIYVTQLLLFYKRSWLSSRTQLYLYQDQICISGPMLAILLLMTVLFSVQ